MLESLKQLFFDRIRAEASCNSARDREHALRLAAAALLVEVSRSDGQIDEQERTVMRAALQSALGLTPDESDELLRLGEAESRSAISVYELTRVVDQELSPEQKKRVVELLWLVAFADSRKDAHEEHLIRRIADLLHVDHPDFIDAKIRARGASSRTG
jgi:uncharacterized tellurite resistance protein B-like protein